MTIKTGAAVSTDYLAHYGHRLLAQGFPIIPIRSGTKHPGFKGWQQIRATPNLVSQWLSTEFSTAGIGVLTRHFPAIDLDVLDAEIVQKLVNWCHTHIGPTLQRVGAAPKQLLVYRTDRPFRKMTSAKYIDFLGLEHKVEILGAGQQFVAYAIHPETHKPYQWISKQQLIDIRADDLACITEDQAQALMSYFESLIPEDWRKISVGQGRKAAGKLALSGQAASFSKKTIQAGQKNHHDKAQQAISTDQLKAALTVLDPDMRMHEWVQVGMALYHQYQGSGEGFALWDRWSAEGQKYQAAEMRVRWRSFRVDHAGIHPVTAATILHFTKQSDLLRKKAASETEGADALLGNFLDRYVLIEQGNLVCDLKKPPHCAVSKLEEFRNVTANIRHLVPMPTRSNPGKEKLQPVHTSWLIDPVRKTAQGVQYDPAKPFFFQDVDHPDLWWVNECYLPVFKQDSQTDLSVFYDHMTYLFPVDRERDWFISWIAFNLQKPHLRCKVTPLHVSVAHGTGRGWIVELMGRLLGDWNCTKTKMETLAGEGIEGAYQDYMNKSLFCAIEEVREGRQRYAISDKIRDKIESRSLSINVKYGGKSTKRVFTNFFLMTNHPDALVLTEEDRRINVFAGPQKVRDRQYYMHLYQWLETDGVDALYQHLIQRDLSDFDWTYCLNTAARQRMIQGNRSETETLFHELRADPPFMAMTFAQIMREMTKLSERDALDAMIDEGQLVKLLQHHAEQSKRMLIGGRGGKAVRPWILNPQIAGDPAAIRQAIEACGL